MKSGKVLLGILAGVAAGALVGILFAPEKGSRTRKKIMDKGEGYADGLKDTFEEFVDSLNKKYQSTVHDVENIVAKGKSKYENAMLEVNELVAKDKAKFDGIIKD
ncbi:hypothetical protein GCM10011514_50140 [Emticicia aquatilis]|uniref:YtxH domain-containing protein n=1 Tax=Emticicia aquatilis TaxID=1537369 RepID=A0A916Z7E6_9BACT|nr:YtxH domain-containing protein [Emticicia aquatilis]GGD80125.1 hypothetical protein GCM10011514_50140 [Emticicia aquatilis]